MSNYNNVCIAVFWLLYGGVSQKSCAPALWCPSQRYVLCSTCVSVLSMWVSTLGVCLSWLPGGPSCCVSCLQLGISLQQGTGKCIMIPSDVHHNFIYGSISGFVSIALASFLHLWNSWSLQWEGFWQLHLDLSGNITFIWCYHCFGICNSSCNSELRDCSRVLEASDLVKVRVKGYCRFTLLLSQEEISAGSQMWKLITTTWDGKAVSETYW